MSLIGRGFRLFAQGEKGVSKERDCGRFLDCMKAVEEREDMGKQKGSRYKSLNTISMFAAHALGSV